MNKFVILGIDAKVWDWAIAPAEYKRTHEQLASFDLDDRRWIVFKPCSSSACKTCVARAIDS